MQLFWINLLQSMLGVQDAIPQPKFETPVSTAASDHSGYIDVLIPAAEVIVEQKSLDIDLAKPEVRQGRKITPAQQALAHAQDSPLPQQPHFTASCSLAELWAHDCERNVLRREEPLFQLLLKNPPKSPVVVRFPKSVSKINERVVRDLAVVEAGAGVDELARPAGALLRRMGQVLAKVASAGVYASTAFRHGSVS